MLPCRDGPAEAVEPARNGGKEVSVAVCVARTDRKIWEGRTNGRAGGRPAAKSRLRPRIVCRLDAFRTTPQLGASSRTLQHSASSRTLLCCTAACPPCLSQAPIFSIPPTVPTVPPMFPPAFPPTFPPPTGTIRQSRPGSPQPIRQLLRHLRYLQPCRKPSRKPVCPLLRPDQLRLRLLRRR